MKRPFIDRKERIEMYNTRMASIAGAQGTYSQRETPLRCSVASSMSVFMMLNWLVLSRMLRTVDVDSGFSSAVHENGEKVTTHTQVHLALKACA